MSEQLPFERIFVPLIRSARERLRQRVDESLYFASLTENAHEGWERYLLMRLTTACAPAAHWQFQIFQTVSQIFPKCCDDTAQANDALYQAFVGDATKDRLQNLFSEFPLLHDICERLIENWLSAVTEFLVQLESDREKLSRKFGDENCLGRVHAIQAGLSDPHRGGRCVVRVEFENGLTIVHKPRPITVEQHFSGLVDWINEHDVPHKLKAAHCWDRGVYGWMEFISPRPCSTPAQIHEFYWRAGALVALVHLARGVDMHRENLVACGPFPVLIDLETLWHMQEYIGIESKDLQGGVLRTGFLPVGNPNGKSFYDWSSLSCKVFQEYKSPGWVNINQDAMSWRISTKTLNGFQHFPVLEGDKQPADKFVSDIEIGFKWMGNFLLNDDDHRAKFISWLRSLSACPRRRVLRSSVWYQGLRERLLSPKALLSGATPDLLNSSEMPLSSAESDALKQSDIPYICQSLSRSQQEADAACWLPSIEEFAKQASELTSALSSRG